MLARTCYQTVLDRLAMFPAVVLLGPRQVGKTTLAEAIAADRDSVYLDLENPRDRGKLADSNRYLEANEGRLVVLDEVHRAPELFQVLRGVTDRGRRKGLRTGRFLLLGSASMALMKQSGESLAGRVAYVSLTPVNALEANETTGDRLWVRGGFPDSFLGESDEHSVIWRVNFIKSYLERDIPELGPRIPAETLRRFWTMLAHGQGGVLNAAQPARSLGVDGKTVSRYLDLMLVRRLPAYHANVNKRLVKSPKVYVRDSGVLHALLSIADREALFGHPILGASWEGFVIDNIASVVQEGGLMSFYRTSAGAELDLIVEFPGLSERWAIEIKSRSTPKPTRGFYSALEDVAPDKTFVVYAGDERYPLSEGVDALGLSEVMGLIGERN